MSEPKATVELKIRLTKEQHRLANLCAKYRGQTATAIAREGIVEKLLAIEEEKEAREAARRAKRLGTARVADVPGEEPRRGPGRPKKIHPIPETISVSGAIDIADSDDTPE